MTRRQDRDRPKREPPIVAGRVPPNDLDAEATVLSAALLSAEARDVVLGILQAEHFYSEPNGHIFAACLALAEESKPVDVVSVASWLRDRELIQRVGGTRYLAELTEGTPAVFNVEHHAHTVRDKWRMRQAIVACQRIAAEGYGDVGDVQSFLDEAEHALTEIARTAERTEIVHVKSALAEAIAEVAESKKAPGGVVGVPTGLSGVDSMTSGLRPGSLVVVAGRPGLGKTSLALTWMGNAARPRTTVVQEDAYSTSDETVPGVGSVIFSLEMTKRELAKRMLCAEARVDERKLTSGYATQDDWNRLTSAATTIATLPLWIDDTPGITLLELRAKARRLKAERQRARETDPAAPLLGLVVVDYLQLMRGPKSSSSREQEVAELSRGLKELAKELELPVIALSQLNRAVEGRRDKRPQLSDLRESGAIEQDADVIVFIYRNDEQAEESPVQFPVELIIAKQRGGPTGGVPVLFRRNYTRFDDLAPDYDAPPAPDWRDDE